MALQATAQQPLPQMEEKLFFEGKYNECLDLIRNTIPKLSDYDDRKESLAILGSQCLYEMGAGKDIQSFFETSYRRPLLLLPPTVFFVYINYLLHDNQYKAAITSLQEFREKGKPMSNDEYQQWVQLMIYDGYVNHRKYKKAIKFLKKQHRLDSKLKTELMNTIQSKLKQDQESLIKVMDDSDSSGCSSDSDYNQQQRTHNEEEEQPQEHDEDEKSETERTEEAAQPQTAQAVSSINCILVACKEKIDRPTVFKFVVLVIIVWIVVKVLRRNKKLIHDYFSDFRKLLIMSIGKSRISV